MLHRHLLLSWHFWTGLCSPFFWAPGVTTHSTQLLPSGLVIHAITCTNTNTHICIHTEKLTAYLSMFTHMHIHTHTHTHSLTHMHARTKAHTKIQSYTGTQREKLTSNFHRISQAENNIALYLVPGSVHSPRDVETNLKDLQLHYEICLHTHTKNRACCFYSQTEHTVFTLKQVIHNFFFLMPYQLGWFFQG